MAGIYPRSFVVGSERLEESPDRVKTFGKASGVRKIRSSGDGVLATVAWPQLAMHQNKGADRSRRPFTINGDPASASISDLFGVVAIKSRRGPMHARERVLAQSLDELIWSATSLISCSTFCSNSEIGRASSVGLEPVERQNRKPYSTSCLAKLFREFKRVNILHWTPPLNALALPRYGISVLAARMNCKFTVWLLW